MLKLPSMNCYFFLCLTLTSCTAHLKLRDILCLECQGQWPRTNVSKMQRNCEIREDIRLPQTRAKIGQEKVGKIDVPSCTLQNFRSLTTMSQAVLDRLCRRREPLSSFLLILKSCGREGETEQSMHLKSSTAGQRKLIYMVICKFCLITYYLIKSSVRHLYG